MARKVFYSFHFDKDFWRTQQVRNMNALEGQTLVAANAWEEVKTKGDAAVKKWIDDGMVGKSCVIVLVGEDTSKRPFVTYEMTKGWNEGKGVVAIRIDKLLGKDGRSGVAGTNPLANVKITATNQTLDTFVKIKIPAGLDSKAAYAAIADNIEAWVEEAIKIRAAN